jgi:soluble lytic murein transglycosylase
VNFSVKIGLASLLSVTLPLLAQPAQAKPTQAQLAPARPVSTLSAADASFLALRSAAQRDDVTSASRLGATLGQYEIPAYVDYYQLKPRLRNASSAEIREFLAHYEGSAIADRLRNDWLLELGRQRNWAEFDEQFPKFVVADDLQVKCYGLLSKSLKGQNVAQAARDVLQTPRDYGDACNSLIATLFETGQFDRGDIWGQIRLAAEMNAFSSARKSAALLEVSDKAIAQAFDSAAKVVAHGVGTSRAEQELYVVALARLARSGAGGQASALQGLTQFSAKLKPEQRALAWAQIALPAAVNLVPEAHEYWSQTSGAALTPEGYQWRVRSALRVGDWKLVKQWVEEMPVALRSDPAWMYWQARALKHLEGTANPQANALLQNIAGQTHFYGQLALEELGRKITIPASGAPIGESEMAAIRSNAGFARAMKFFSMGLRFEGTREWNWELRSMSERQTLAAAELARENNILDRMVNTSDRTKSEFDFTQRFPSPHLDIMQLNTQTLGLDKAWVYGLIRQESRFMQHAKSNVGAQGLMQLMPATARYVAQKIGLSGFGPEQVNDVRTNILLGTNYLNLVLGTLDGSQTLATAAYNAGPGRPRAWRSRLARPVEGAIFAETIPFTETRGYVKSVLSNATYYAALFEKQPQSLKARLGMVSPKGQALALDIP